MSSATDRWHLGLLALAILLPIVMAGCGGDDASSTSGPSAPLDVVASFYPLQFAVERVGGDRVSVRNLTPAGAEPHDLELTGRDLASLQHADLVVYLSGFSPAVDDAIDSVDATALDVAALADLNLELTPIEEGETSGDGSAIDPHFWLDPTRLSTVAGAIADRLAAMDPEHASEFATNAAALADDLDVLDADYRQGLESCASRDIVTSHNAFGYLAQRYAMKQIGITGLSPDDEPSPADLAAVTRFVRDHDVTTIYFETLVSPAIAETVAAETGASTAVLDPIEGLSDESAGYYLGIMRSNLENLRHGQECS